MTTRMRKTYRHLLLVMLLLGGAFSLVQTSETAWAESGDQAKGNYDQAADGERRAKNAGKSLIGQPGPDVIVATLDDNQIDLGALYGKKPVYLKFWATWCVPCRKQMPGFEKMYEKYGDQIQIIAVNTGFSDTADAARAYRDKMGLTMPITVDDGTLWKALNLRVTPQHVLIDRSGRIAYVGHRDDAELHQALQRVMADGGRPGASTRAADVSTPEVLEVGARVEGLEVRTLADKVIDLAAGSNDKPRGLVFFAPWCESYLAESQPKTAQACRRVRETVDRLAKQGGGIDWIGVSSGLWASTSDLEDYRASTGIAIPLALDASGEIYRAFGIRNIPAVVLIDRNGKVIRKLGPQDRELTQAVQSVVAKEAVDSS